MCKITLIFSSQIRKRQFCWYNTQFEQEVMKLCESNSVFRGVYSPDFMSCTTQNAICSDLVHYNWFMGLSWEQFGNCSVIKTLLNSPIFNKFQSPVVFFFFLFCRPRRLTVQIGWTYNWDSRPRPHNCTKERIHSESRHFLRSKQKPS